MLKSISTYVERYTKILATVTNINVEVADINLVRIAGTGMYSKGVGQSIKIPGNVYKYVMKSKKTVLIDNPREDAICSGCHHLGDCNETLDLCTPIIYNNDAIGVIGIICFTEDEKKRILQHLDLYRDFVQQMSEVITLAVSENQKKLQTESILDTFLEITNVSNHGILTLNQEGKVSYMNEKAKKYLAQENLSVDKLGIRKIGDNLAGMEEFEIKDSKGTYQHVVGNLVKLNSNDISFSASLIFDSLPNYINMISKSISSGNDNGLDSIRGGSKVIIELKQQVLKIANTRSTVLITGESGTGKEMFARAIHDVSSRRDKPFVAINCGAIPDSLLESELFGYVSGAFTGARTSGHVGKFEMAHQGVLFLDEISAMPLYLQVKLLRVLQERTITRLGSNRVIPVDVRIIAATNDDIQGLIDQKMFREDLFYRLNVIPLKISPLRDRLEDIPELTECFLNKYCKLFNKKTIYPTTGLIKALQSYNWPGNVREFENIMEYLVNIIPSGGTATMNMLPSKITAAAKKPLEINNIIFNNQSYTTYREDTIKPLAELEITAITKAVKYYGNSTEGKLKAAEALGIGVATLYRKLKNISLDD